ncbi:MAG: phosphatidylinositol-specific phospholipase C [Clostridiaceae bacterium]|nr:phosphatidylinositol-specific phospholipase C [Clostridiaceae bacterium]
MHKKTNTAKAISILLMFVIILSVSNTYVKANEMITNTNDYAYWYEESISINNPSWMANLADDKNLSQISVPGTHDTMAYNDNLTFGNITRTQCLSLDQQLNAGIRYLDIRLNYQKDHFKINHGPVYLGYNFTDVLETVTQFLSQNPSEFILMRIKHEYGPASSEELLHLFNKYFENYSDIFFHSNQVNFNPLVSEMRSKVVLLSEIPAINYGLLYNDLNIQDHYFLKTVWNIADKWEFVRGHLDTSNNSISSEIYLNHLSATGGVLPYTVASGKTLPDTNGEQLWTGVIEDADLSPEEQKYPYFIRKPFTKDKVAVYYDGTNNLTANYINDNSITRTGIIVADFPGPKLINAVIAANYR